MPTSRPSTLTGPVTRARGICTSHGAGSVASAAAEVHTPDGDGVIRGTPLSPLAERIGAGLYDVRRPGGGCQALPRPSPPVATGPDVGLEKIRGPRKKVLASPRACSILSLNFPSRPAAPPRRCWMAPVPEAAARSHAARAEVVAHRGAPPVRIDQPAVRRDAPPVRIDQPAVRRDAPPGRIDQP